ncbi:MAG: hypothetical protein HZA62_02430 [Rhodocyclales bacterium]|nr:hypothetical protein [Rhodocyclales bacterium]
MNSDTGDNDWTNSGNAASSNNSYATVSLDDGEQSDYLQCTNFNFTIPSSATINGITVSIERKSTATNTADRRVRIVKGGTRGSDDLASSTGYPSSDTVAAYGGSAALWSETWTAADINSTGFGAALSAEKTDNSGGARTVSIDHIEITVDYTEGGGVVSGGCTESTVGSDTLITCTSSGTFTAPSGVTRVRYLVVAGGGGGGGIGSDDEEGAGGGGGGGVKTGTSLTVTAGTTYNVTVGSGGTTSSNSDGSDGGNSTFSTVTATGGGGGAREGGHDGSSGGSGGGGSGNGNGGSGSSGQGYAGGDGDGSGTQGGAGGGGGAGAVGSNGSGTSGGNGGVGVSDDITGSATYYGGGGGGGGYGVAGGNGGNGGGGAAPATRAAGTAGTANTGGGGGGATGSSLIGGSSHAGGTGGSGIVILRYNTSTSCMTFRDEFSSNSYSRNDGTGSWTGNWTETGDNGSSSNGTIQISSNKLQLEGDGSGGSATFGGPSIEREANLSSYTSATLSFDYSESGTWESTDYVDVWVSGDGGANWTKIHSFQDDQGSTTQTFSQDVSAYISSNFRVAFVERASQSSEIFYIDNVQIDGCTTTTSLDHVRLEHSGAGVTCVREPVTVKACQNADCSTLYSSGSVSVTLAPSGGWYTAAAGGTASDALSFTGSTTAYLEQTTAASTTLSGSGVSPSAANGVKCYVGATESCSLAFSDAGFVLSAAAGDVETTVPAQIAGTASGTYYLRAVKTSTTSKACEAALTGANTVNFAYECANPATCYGSDLMSVNGGSNTTIARNNSGSSSSTTSVAMTFDANGNAPFTFSYSDVGEVKLHMSKSASGSLTKALSGASNAFVVKPSGFVLSDIKQTASPNLANPAAADAAGAAFVKAGESFSVTVTAKAGSSTAYSFGRESTPEEVTLTHVLVAPSGGTAGTLSNTTIAGSSFTNGVATVTNLAWGEVGIITLALGNGDYLGAGSVTGTTSGNVGRFYPDHFDTEVTHACASGNFTYSGQPFPLKFTAKNLAGATTTNYTGSFAKTVTLADANGAGGAFSPTTLAATDFSAGIADLTATPSVSFSFTDKLTGPATLKVRGSDGEASSSGGSEGTTALRSGRLRLSNAFGSEKRTLTIPVQAQYWSGSSWVLNSSDNCTNLASTAFSVSGGIAASTGVSSVGQIGVSPNTGGNGTLVLTAPNTTGSVDVCVDLGPDPAGGVTCSATSAANSWLQSRWPPGTGYNNDPPARATFGIYAPETRRTVHIRESY